MSTHSDDTTLAGPPGVPTTMKVAAAVTALEGAVLVVLAVAEVLDLSSGRVAMGLTTSAFFLIFGLGLFVCVRGLLQLRTWSRGPVLMAQLMALLLAWSFREGDTRWISVLLTVPSAVGLVAMLLPSTLRAWESADLD